MPRFYVRIKNTENESRKKGDRRDNALKYGERRTKLHLNSSFENQRFTIPKRLGSIGDKAKISRIERRTLTHTHINVLQFGCRSKMNSDKKAFLCLHRSVLPNIFRCIRRIFATGQMKIGCEQREKGILLYYLWTSELYLWDAFEDMVYIRDIFQYTILHQASLPSLSLSHTLTLFLFIGQIKWVWPLHIALLERSIFFLMKSGTNWMESFFLFGIRFCVVRCKIEFTCSCVLNVDAPLCHLWCSNSVDIKISLAYACERCMNTVNKWKRSAHSL